jgi:hypothetical protein
MKAHFRRLGCAAVCAAVLGLASAPNAEATLLVAIEVNGVQACAVDNNAACAFGTQILDIDPTPGVMSFGNVPVQIGILALTGSSQQATFGPPENILNTSSAQVTNTSGSLIASGFFAVSATDFVGPVSQGFASGAATWQDAVGSAISMQWYNDALNRQGAESATDLPGILLSVCNDSITLTADSTACADAASVMDPGPFSMTLFTQFSLVPGGTVVNRGQTMLKPVEIAAVPEPASLLLLSSAFGAASYVARHRARRRKPTNA